MIGDRRTTDSSDDDDVGGIIVAPGGVLLVYRPGGTQANCTRLLDFRVVAWF